MVIQRRRLAKVTAPSLSGISARERLLRLMDQYRAAPVLWVCGPSGAGKTALVASYFEKRKRAVSWNKLDRGDLDASTFFYYLGLAVPARKNRALPLLTPEYLPDIAKFAYRFFREFFVLVPNNGAVVLDNWHEIDDVGALQEALRCACEEVPTGVQLVVVSRHEPPLTLARLRAHGKVAVLGWSELRLTADESTTIAKALQPVLSDTTISGLHRRASGWVTGLSLLLEEATPGAETKLEATSEATIFDYFAGDLFKQSTSDVRALWLNTALLPNFSAKQAHAVCRNISVDGILDELCRRHLFIEKRGSVPSYEYHSLFRGFLVKQVRQELSEAEFASLQRRSANLLLAAGQIDEAVNLYLDAHAWDDATRLILQQASILLACGRSVTLSEWVLSLPSFRVDTNPRLLYCLGAAQIPINAGRARRFLERAHKCFLMEGNVVGEALAIAGVLEANYYQYSSYIGLEDWIDKLIRLLDSGVTFPSPEAELMTCAWLLMAMTMRSPRNKFVPYCAERVVALIERGAEVNRLVVAGALLLNHFDYFADDKAQHVLAVIKPHLSAVSLTPFNRLWWLLTEAQHCLHGVDQERLREAFTQARLVIEESGLRATPMLELYISFWDQVARGEVVQASSLAPRVKAMLDPKRRQEQLLFAWLAGVVELSRGNVLEARNYACEYVRVATETGSDCMLVWGFGLAALTTCMVGDNAEASRLLAAARSQRTPWHGERIDHDHHLIGAFIRLSSGDFAGAQTALKAGFAVGRKHNYLQALPWVPAVMARLCGLALEAGIEVDYATRLIRTRHLRAPRFDVARWPWPVRIRSLGQFQVYVHDALLKPSRKAPKKPLDLLKLLVALGGDSINSQLVCDTLWPDSEGDAAPKALSMALHRLRKLLGSDAVVLLQDGKLSLNREACWVDVWALGAIAQLGTSSPATTTEQLFSLYQGEFATSDTEDSWILAARERWQSQYVRLIISIAENMEQENDWMGALEIYRRALESAVSVQELHRRIMLCHLKLNQRDEVVQTYIRCRNILHQRGIAPDSRLESIRAEAEQSF
jgi:LuxR family transcriptional regulator, maltose regulon positive regulatory protein